MFAALKTRGFNLEATHITKPEKLAPLVSVLALAAPVAYNVGLWAEKQKATAIKTHGRKEKSVIRRGLETLARLFAGAESEAQKIFFAAPPDPKRQHNILILQGVQK